MLGLVFNRRLVGLLDYRLFLSTLCLESSIITLQLIYLSLQS